MLAARLKFNMRKVILLIGVLFSFCSYSQTINEAFEFINEREFDWACEPYADKTSERRNTFELKDGKLMIKTRMPEYGYGFQSKIKYYEYIIDLKKVNKITWSGPSSKCNTININTSPYGFNVKVYDRSGNGTIKNDLSKSWNCDSIKVRGSSQASEQAKRLIKAIRFLAESYGAKIVDSNF